MALEKFEHEAQVPTYRFSRLRRGLLPLAGLHALALKTHQAWLKRQLPPLTLQPATPPKIPFLVVGGLRLRGSGKTSVTADLAQWLIHQGRRVAVLAYQKPDGWRPIPTQNPCTEITLTSDWRAFSDEALLLKHLLPQAQVYVTRHRLAAWHFLAQTESPPDCIISDDGLLDPRLQAAQRLVLLRHDEKPTWKNLFPAGPYRGTLGLLRAGDFILRGPVSKPNPPANPTALAEMEKDPAHFHRSVLWPAMDWNPSLPVMALCGHGDALGFFHSLSAMGLTLSETLCVRNHAGFSVPTLLAMSQRHRGQAFVCAPRDAIKLLPNAQWGDFHRGFTAVLPLAPGEEATLVVCGHRLEIPERVYQWVGEHLIW
jgi:tetraacyldisaccharide 4'-kinase